MRPSLTPYVCTCAAQHRTHCQDCQHPDAHELAEQHPDACSSLVAGQQVLHWMAKCSLKLGRLDNCKRDLLQASTILSTILPGHNGALDDVKETQAHLYLELKQHKRVIRILKELGTRPVVAEPSASTLRRLTMLVAALCGHESWAEAPAAVERAVAEAAALWLVLQNAGVPNAYQPVVGFRS